MNVTKKAIFRVQINDLRTKKSKVISIYSNGESPTLEQFKEKIIQGIEGEKK